MQSPMLTTKGPTLEFVSVTWFKSCVQCEAARPIADHGRAEQLATMADGAPVIAT